MISTTVKTLTVGKQPMRARRPLSGAYLSNTYRQSLLQCWLARSQLLIQPGDIGAAKLCFDNRNALFSCVNPCEPRIFSRYCSAFKRNPERVDFPCDSFPSSGFLARHDAGVLYCPSASSPKLSDIFGSHSKVVEGNFES